MPREDEKIDVERLHIDPEMRYCLARIDDEKR